MRRILYHSRGTDRSEIMSCDIALIALLRRSNEILHTFQSGDHSKKDIPFCHTQPLYGFLGLKLVKLTIMLIIHAT